MRKIVMLALAIMVAATGLSFHTHAEPAGKQAFKLGDDLLIDKYHQLIDGKKIGLITNQSGVNSEGKPIIDILANYPNAKLTALYGPEHGIDGKAKAGDYVASYTHPTLNIPVYSLYGETRMPTEEMLGNIDLLVYDIQDVGARYYTYISTLNYAMVAAQKYNKPIIVLDRPNPLGGKIVEGPVLEEPYQSFVGVDLLPTAHGMTVGELAQFFNRNIGADLVVIPMEGYSRSTIWQDTGLPWIPTSPMMPDIDAVFGYMATGMGDGTGIFQSGFKWIGGKGLDEQKFADLLNKAHLDGVTFVPEKRGEAGGVRLKITDYHGFNPAKTGIYALAYAHQLTSFKVPKSGKTVVMFDKIMGTNKIGQYLEQGLSPQEITAKYADALARFKEERKQYLIYPDQQNAEPAPQQDQEEKTTPPQTEPKPAGQEKAAYLTIDDGPSASTGKLLDIMKAHQVKATFFVVGRNVKGHEAVLKRAVQEGHTLGGHTYSHNYTAIYRNEAAFFNDLEKGNQLIAEATGVKPTLIRFPGGSNNTVSKRAQDPKLYGNNQWIMNDLVKAVKEKGYDYFDWNVSLGDADGKVHTADELLERVKEGAKNKNEVIILCHDAATKQSTVAALPKIIEYLKSQGYTFKTLDQGVTPVVFLK